MSNVLYSATEIDHKVADCAKFVDAAVTRNNNTVICPILQSSFYFTSNLFSKLLTTPQVDFCGVSFYDKDGLEDGLYMYKGPDVTVYDNKHVIIIDVITNTGTTLDYVSKFLKQMGAKSVTTACLLYRQFSKHNATWKGFTISDELVYGYGIDHQYKHRTLPYIAYE